MPLDIAITGAGVVSSIGTGVTEFQRALALGQVCAAPPPFSDRPAYSGVYVSPVLDFDPARHGITAQVAKVADRSTLLALAAAAEAVAAAGLEARLAPDRTAVVVGTALSAVGAVAAGQAGLDAHGPEGLPGKLQIAAWPNMTAAQILMRWRLSGPLLTVATACASSLDAIGIAAGMIARGEADVAIAGGTDSAMNEVCVLSALRYGMMRPQASAATACRPFDRARDGIMAGEGAGFVILERVETAQARGAPLLGVIAGYASGGDPYHITSPDPSGAGEAAIMKRALFSAGLGRGDIDAVIAHATGTPAGDLAEARALGQVFGSYTGALRVTSIKGHIGHTTGAAGVMGLIAALGAMKADAVPPTAGTTELDPEVGFRVPLDGPALGPVDAVLVNAFGFGGQNASLVVTRG